MEYSTYARVVLRGLMPEITGAPVADAEEGAEQAIFTIFENTY